MISIISYYAAGIIGLISALVVASSLNPIHRIAFLILVFLSGSFIMIILDFYFLGLTYIIVYVGAIMILFLFVIMMVQIHLIPITAIAPRILTAKSSQNKKTSNLSLLALDEVNVDEPGILRTRQSVLPKFLSFYILLIPILFYYILILIKGNKSNSLIVNYLFPSWFVEYKTMTDLETLANILYLGYPTALLLIGVTLWVVLIGIIKVTATKA